MINNIEVGGNVATSFDEIYAIYFQITNDTNIKTSPTDEGYEILFTYLFYSISLFADYCYKDLNNRIDFERNFQYISADGSTNSFVLNFAPFLDGEFLVTIDGEELNSDEYVYDNLNSRINIDRTSTELKDKQIYICSYRIGQFNEDLNVQEKNFLADGMTIAFKRNKLDSTILQNIRVYGKDFQVYSQSAHIRELRTAIENNEKDLYQKIMMYSWKQNKNIEDILHG